ncbi:MAG: hypothetical protein IPP82_07345 [Xanthomonadales bacterium]|nr:hypothetical protein [Xanthomonadales bacterium]
MNTVRHGSTLPVAGIRHLGRQRILLGGVLAMLLSSAALAADPPVKLNGSMVAGGRVSASQVSPDDRIVVYVANQDVDGVNELYSVPIGGGVPIKLNLPLVSDVDSLRRIRQGC